MEFRIGRNIFLDGIQKTLGIVEKKTTMPILNNVMIRASKQGIKISATDREIGLVADYEASVDHEGEVTLSDVMLDIAPSAVTPKMGKGTLGFWLF